MSIPSTPLCEQCLNYDDICHIIDTQSFWVEYEPIIDMKNGDIYGYEALARFVLNGKQIPPTPVLHVAHQDKELFVRHERALKNKQLAHRPEEGGLFFVNIDPHNNSHSEKIAYWHDFCLKRSRIFALKSPKTPMICKPHCFHTVWMRFKKVVFPSHKMTLATIKNPFVLI